ncbi:MAG: thiopurine S-methyltransferase, partial [Steroidobacteraceae bacterium]
MQPDFWHARWQAGQIGFHQSTVDRHLGRHWPDLGLAKGSRVFAPLCGKSLDLVWLRERGHSVAGVELSAVALESFCMEQGVPARRLILDHFDVYEAPQIQLYRGDFFKLTPALLGTFSANYDRASLISWTPDRRSAYVAQMAALSKPGTITLLVVMEYPQAQMPGPPFSLSAEDIDLLYSGSHAIQPLSKQDILANEPRLRSRGLTQLHEVCY